MTENSPLRFVNGARDGRALPSIPVGLQQANQSRMRGGHHLYFFHRSVGGSIVGNDDFPFEPGGPRRRDHTLKERGHEFLFVVEGNENR